MIAAASQQRVDTLYRALADLTRLRILRLLLKKELCVCDLVDALEVPQPKVSRHLAYLRRAGLVTARKDGLWSYYKLAPARNPLHKNLLEGVALCDLKVPQAALDDGRISRRLMVSGRCR
ncbi:MAG: helix-turn-helix transcriptional regulator [Planctomycetes bacterium]|nr:helix-turn-helix transcriptional regulator [Planctomycetota bacterium]